VFDFLQVHLNQAAAGKRPTWKYADPEPRRYILPARASTIDSRAGEHSEIDFVFTAGGKVQDLQQAIVDTPDTWFSWHRLNGVTTNGRMVK
jgi:hypothetical protein